MSFVTNFILNHLKTCEYARTIPTKLTLLFRPCVAATGELSPAEEFCADTIGPSVAVDSPEGFLHLSIAAANVLEVVESEEPHANVEAAEGETEVSF